MGIAKGTVKAHIKQHHMHDKGRRMLAVDRLGSKKTEPSRNSNS